MSSLTNYFPKGTEINKITDNIYNLVDQIKTLRILGIIKNGVN